ncbi:MAG: cation diffusion facilitator family transporter [Actinobacteria bacterium]|nr:cation diffusion facilitator family transporter [Actinomycetota bacterium]
MTDVRDAASLGIDDQRRLHQRASRLQWFLVVYNVVEGAVAVTAGILAGSVALIGFGVDSAIEVIADGAVALRLRRAGVEASDEARERAERQALRVVAITFFALAVYIAVEAGSTLLNGEEPETSVVGLVLSVLSLLIMPATALAQHRTGRRLGSRAVLAAAVETWVCAYLSLALLVGIGLHFAFGWAWADPVAALAMLPVVIWQGFETLEEARDNDDG